MELSTETHEAYKVPGTAPCGSRSTNLAKEKALRPGETPFARNLNPTGSFAKTHNQENYKGYTGDELLSARPPPASPIQSTLDLKYENK